MKIEEKEYLKILRDDDVEKFKELDLLIQKSSFMMQSYLLIPFMNTAKKLKIANYIVDNNPDIDYSYLVHEIVSHNTSLDYPEKLFDKIMNEITRETLTDNKNIFVHGAFQLLIGTDYYLKNRDKFNPKEINYNRILDMYSKNEGLIKTKSIENLFKNVHIEGKIEEVFFKLLKSFRTMSGYDRTKYKSLLDHAAVFMPSPESVINMANNSQEKGLLSSVIKNAEFVIRKNMAENEKELILKELKPNKNKVASCKKKRI